MSEPNADRTRPLVLAVLLLGVSGDIPKAACSDMVDRICQQMGVAVLPGHSYMMSPGWGGNGTMDLTCVKGEHAVSDGVTQIDSANFTAKCMKE